MTEFLNLIKETNAPINIVSVSAAVVVALVLAVIVFFTHKLTTDEFEYDKNFGLVLLIVPAVVALMISVTGTVVRALSIAGVLAIIRYRSMLTKPKDLAFIFMSVALGFISGVNMFLAALIFTIVLCVATIIYSVATADRPKNIKKTLKIAIPESIDYAGLFDAALTKYTNARKLTSVRIISGGTVTELTYAIKLKNENDTKAFLDELRTLNANFKIEIKEYGVWED